MALNNGNYTVGYGNPPVATRFKNGQSGNPGGRPKAKPKTTTLGDEIERAFNELVLIEHPSGQRRMMTMRQATAFQIAYGAAMGNPKFVRLAELLSPAAQDIADRPQCVPNELGTDLSKLTPEDAGKVLNLRCQIEAILAKARSKSSGRKAPPENSAPTPR